MAAHGPEAELAELRTVVLRAREQAMQVTLTAQRARAALQAERDRLRQQRDDSERALRDDLRAGRLDPGSRQVAERLERGETSWRAVLSGQDDERSSSQFRESVGERTRAIVAELREHDPEFRRAHDTALEQAGTDGESRR
ncbi:hypothetical protein ACT8ZV_04170 [Nocardioides sp. MAHUQ-72]|uniref:hypothetical protein n=1 Tax=unclassified Nocardioides TaxID=2615069 RepID=UPI0036141C8B